MPSEPLEHFLRKHLPDRTPAQISALVRRLNAISSEVARRAERRQEWENEELRRLTPQSWPAGRLAYNRQRLEAIIAKIDELMRLIEGAQRDGHLVGEPDEAFQRLRSRAQKDLLKVQRNGRPTDQARVYLVHKVAAVFWSAFKKEPKVSGSASNRRAQRGPFYALLRLIAHPKMQLSVSSIRRDLQAWRTEVARPSRGSV